MEVEADTALFFLGLSTLSYRSQVIWGVKPELSWIIPEVSICLQVLDHKVAGTESIQPGNFFNFL